jgi:hypothetical protein
MYAAGAAAVGAVGYGLYKGGKAIGSGVGRAIDRSKRDTSMNKELKAIEKKHAQKKKDREKKIAELKAKCEKK